MLAEISQSDEIDNYIDIFTDKNNRIVNLASNFIGKGTEGKES
jgi:hypothetical protein